MSKSAFVLRIAPNGIDLLPDSLVQDQITIGWSNAIGLLNPDLIWEQFREVVSVAYHAGEPNYRRAGRAAGNLWRFIRDMKPGDLVVVPYWSEFYVAEVSSAAMYRTECLTNDSAYRRDVHWLNDKKPMPRTLAKSALLSRMKTQGTSADATDLIADIENCLSLAKVGELPRFDRVLQRRLIEAVVDEIRSGHMEDYGFERLIESVFKDLGATEVKLIARNKDEGADLLATFIVAGAFQQVVAVQAKHWQPNPPVGSEVVRQLINGIEAESANLGVVVTSGTISDEATLEAEKYYDQTGVKIELMDGEQLAKLMVENGILVR